MRDQPPKSDVATRLIEAAAEILASKGPAALSLRSVALAADISTMAVYTHFGSMPALVAATVEEAYTRLAQRLAAVPRTDDALADLLRIGIAYLDNARENPMLYATMTGAVPLGKFGSYDVGDAPGRLQTLQALIDAVARAMEAGALDESSPPDFAAQLLTAMHGYVLLEAGGSLGPDAYERVLRPMMRSLCTSRGCDPDVFDALAARYAPSVPAPAGPGN